MQALGAIYFLAGWHKRLLNQASVSFVLFCTHVSSFLAWFTFFCVMLVCSNVFSILVKWLVEKAECFAPVKRLAGEIIT